jgi:taurine dioxygenase
MPSASATHSHPQHQPHKDGLQIHQIGGTIGAEIRGVKISGDLPRSTVLSIHQALLRHKVLFFRDQKIDDATQEAFARLWGKKLIAHPTIPSLDGTEAILDVDGKNSRASNWHTDFTFVDAYPSISILRAVVLPEVGGDTIWANMVAAYNDLPEALRELAEKVWALHTNDYDYAATHKVRPEGLQRFNEVFTKQIFQTEHPLVRVHPDTGERVLLVGYFIKKLIGFGSADSRKLLEIFHDHATSPENTIRWHWRSGDLAMWDNNATMHRAVDDYDERPRVMHRTTIEGIAPVSVDGRGSRTLEIADKPRAAA